jgi:energy-coupling factor transport system permease protein
MESAFKKCNVAAISLFCAAITAVIFSADNPVILLGIFITELAVFGITRSCRKLINGMKMFIPFSAITILINMMFVYEGKITLFYILGKRFTLESLIYAAILSFKLLLIIYVFMMLELLIDSDRAASYFSSRIPKTTLTMMIALKLFPNMKERMLNLMDVYSLRGVKLNAERLWDKARGNIPVMSILLENSLDGAFDIGEAAYVRGFLSGNRTNYDKQAFEAMDYIVTAESLALIGVFIYAKLNGMTDFEIYGASQASPVNQGVVLLTAIILIIISTFVLYSLREGKEKVIYNGHEQSH